MVGRESELAEIELLLEGIDAGPRLLTISGEAGIGKTTLWSEARRRARCRDALVLSCRPSVAEAKLSFAALSDLLAEIGADAIASLPPPQRDALEVALLRSRPAAGPGSAAGRAGAGQPAARPVAAGLLSLLRALAAERTVVLAVDDWQWLDAPSRRAIEFAVRRLEVERVGLLCSFRTPSPGPTLGGAVAEELGLSLTLGPLSLAQLGMIVSRRIGRPLPRPMLVRLWRTSAGNPFHALEIARMLETADPACPAAGSTAWLPVPDDLRRLTAARIGRLPADTRDALLMAAAIDGPDGDSVDLEALAPAEEDGIVTVSEAGRVEFTHPLLAAAAYGSLPVAGRRRLHRLAADRVRDPEQRARHLALACERPDGAVAAQLDAAAELAASRGAPDAAAELIELAARLTPAGSGDMLAARLLSAARFQLEAGGPANAEALAVEAQRGSPPRSLRARALQLQAQLCACRGGFTQALRLSEAALAAAGGDRRLRAGIELDLVFCAVSLGDIAGAEPYARAAVADAQAANADRDATTDAPPANADRDATTDAPPANADRDATTDAPPANASPADAGAPAADGTLADALAVLTMVEFLAGRGVRRGRLARALALEDPRAARSFVLHPRFIRGLLELWTGELGLAVHTLQGLHDETVARGQEAAAPMLLPYLAWAHVWRGDLPRAERLSEAARQAAALLDDPTVLGVSLSTAALVHAHDGRTERARAEAEQALGLLEAAQWRSGVIWPLWALGLALLSDGRPADVDAKLGPLADGLAAMGAGDPAMAVFLPDEIEALVALGDLHRARALLEPFEHAARRLERPWAIAAAERCRGSIASAQGDAGEARIAFERALAAHDRTGMPFERARTLLLAGIAHRRRRQRGAARAALGEALAEFDRIGARAWAARARAELERAGAPTRDRDQLTATERRLAELAAEGLTNREVAERAFVTVKTVEANLTRAYRKLGVRSRVALANALRDGAGPAREGSG